MKRPICRRRHARLIHAWEASLQSREDKTVKVAAVIVAAGRGLRAGGHVPKQYLHVLGEPLIRPALAAFAGHGEISIVQPVIHPDDEDLYKSATEGLHLLTPANGANSRQGSVRAGLEALQPHSPELVLVHDAARPFVSQALITRAIKAARASGAAVPVIGVTDTVKTVDATGVVMGTLDRAIVRMVQTPQAFGFTALLEAHRRAQTAGCNDFTDDAALVEWAGLKVTTFDGETENVKLTSNEDFARAEFSRLAALSDIRTGFGFDVHQFVDGDHVMLGGVRVSHNRGLAGHSDADVVLHALVDAILGALAEGDIGVHFSPTDPQWRGASSDRFLAFAIDRVRARGGRLAHLDVTVVCEAPRIGPQRDCIRSRIAELAGIPVGRVGLKATTSEKMGFTGRGEGMAAFANATVRLPWSD
jgi:2-C-methyl-D-erythritol 4-phosphate cytidylyltransferase/2-C-methyl-D-erythritol 2,4-cyclodiphosphate synthase